MKQRVKASGAPVDAAAAADRAGRPTVGLYPQVARRDLCKATGLSKSALSHLLRGRNKCSLEIALKLAAAVGVTVEQLYKDLAKQAKRFKGERKAGRKAERAA